jgi:ParB family chromosome partitioning protein
MAHGYNDGCPIHVWDSEDGHVILDGHTRVAIATELEIGSVPCHLIKFDDERLALEYAISSQRDRRNLTKDELTHT